MRLEIDRLDKVGEAFRSRSSYIQSKVNKYGSELAADIDQRYEGGHIVGDQFGGPPEEINAVAMLEEVNQTRVGKESNSYLLLERKFAAKPENYGLLGVFGQCLFVFQAAFFRSRKSLSTSFGVRYPRAE